MHAKYNGAYIPPDLTSGVRYPSDQSTVASYNLAWPHQPQRLPPTLQLNIYMPDEIITFVGPLEFVITRFHCRHRVYNYVCKRERNDLQTVKILTNMNGSIILYAGI